MGLEVRFVKGWTLERFHKVSCEKLCEIGLFLQYPKESQLIYLNNTNLHNNN